MNFSRGRTPPEPYLAASRRLGYHVLQVFFLLDAGEGHLVAGDEALRIGDVLQQVLFVPSDASALHRRGIGEAFQAAGLTADQAVQARADALLAFLKAVAGLALAEDLLAFSGVASRSGRNASHQSDAGHQAEQHMLFHSVIPRGS